MQKQAAGMCSACMNWRMVCQCQLDDAEWIPRFPGAFLCRRYRYGAKTVRFHQCGVWGQKEMAAKPEKFFDMLKESAAAETPVQYKVADQNSFSADYGCSGVDSRDILDRNQTLTHGRPTCRKRRAELLPRSDNFGTAAG